MGKIFKRLAHKLLIVLMLSAILTTVGYAAAGQASAEEDASKSTASSVVAQPIEGPSVAQKLGSRAKTSWPWYVARGSGLVAAGCLVVLLLSGIGQISGYTFRLLDPITAWASHRALGIAFGVAVLIHMFSLLFDHFVPFNVWQILVPWLSDYKPVTIWGMHLGSLYVALGVLSFYLIALVVITSLLWVEKKPALWKLVHLMSYVIMLFVFVHALYIGTDTGDGLARALWIFAGVVIAVACVHRLWRAKTI